MEHAARLPRSLRFRPPHPMWWLIVFVVCASLIGIALDVPKIAAGDVSLHMVLDLAAAVVAVILWWPSLKSPYMPVRPSVQLLVLSMCLSLSAAAS